MGLPISVQKQIQVQKIILSRRGHWMIINKKRIISVDKYVDFVADNQELYICVEANEKNKGILKNKGIIDTYNVGYSILPAAVGPITHFNINGKFVVYKDQEMEERTFERAYHVIDWHGTDHYGTCFQTKPCHPRKYIAPPLEIITLGKDYITSRILLKKDKNILKHIINMFLEIFRYCIIVDNNKTPITKDIKVKEVQWRILPPGKYPWEKAEKELKDYFKKMPIKNKTLVEHRHQFITENEPDFMAIGEESFNGYVVYGYNKTDIYIFEPNEPNNATYIFKGKWEKASKLTKREIIRGDLCYKRLVHSPEWKKQLSNILKI